MDDRVIYDNYSALGILSRPITEGKEFDMVKEFIKFREGQFHATSTKELLIFLETKINNSYPDIIFAEYNPEKYEDWNRARNRLTTKDLKIFHFIYKNENVTSPLLIKELAIQYKTLQRSIEALMDAHLVERKDGYWNIPNKNKIFGVSKLEAVEAKIGKWNEVVQQAIINTTFASESFVLSKRQREPDDFVIQQTHNFGIGIYLYKDNQFSTFSKARRNRFPVNYNSIYLNECIGRIQNS